jgi:hypothetical protein
MLHSNRQEALSTNSAQLISNTRHPQAVVLLTSNHSNRQMPTHILNPQKQNSRQNKKFTSYAYHNVQDPVSSSSVPSQSQKSLPTLQDCTSSNIRYKRDLQSDGAPSNIIRVGSDKHGSMNSADRLRYTNKYNKGIQISHGRKL